MAGNIEGGRSRDQARRRPAPHEHPTDREHLTSLMNLVLLASLEPDNVETCMVRGAVVHWPCGAFRVWLPG